MTTTVTITGSGTPMPVPGRAGPGALVRHESAMIQIDAGRATALRLAEAGAALTDLRALLITHHHSDHLLGVTDLVLTRWIANGPRPCPPLAVHCPAGPAVDFLRHLFDHLEPDIQSRVGVSGYPSRPEPNIVTFDPETPAPIEVGRFGDVRVDAVVVDHGDLVPAVGYRFTTPDGIVVISGDTVVCPELEAFAAGCDVLVHEAFSSELMVELGAAPKRIENLGHHHSDARSVGEMAARLAVPELLVTHMIPSPRTPEAVAVFADAIRGGGYAGELTIAEDLATATIG